MSNARLDRSIHSVVELFGCEDVIQRMHECNIQERAWRVKRNMQWHARVFPSILWSCSLDHSIDIKPVFGDVLEGLLVQNLAILIDYKHRIVIIRSLACCCIAFDLCIE